ncbi:tRNA pseudouridine(38-40) synthase TruA [Ruania zhangjianzhongii]|uniref:tRNA pseudouridine(38-40) synthase TruA n=1 Tax=Ruania zhangjianzhongii TaxID=2603206 RepID=UPI001F3CD59A|nr:tRNA pseudouridine(38-40) synthase TruA [Ruania zhangjianzhongii]
MGENSGEHTAPPAEPQAPATVRARLDIAYAGTAFSGWARQPGLRTVQQAVEEGLAQVLRLAEPPRLTVAGRTDAGVHARGQVAHVDLPAEQWSATPGRSDRTPAVALAHRLSAVLDDDVVIQGVRQVPETFDARFSALWRRYSYRISDRLTTRDPLRRSSVLWHRRALDETAMNAAAHLLTGEHDFAAYCKPREGATTIRILQEFAWERTESGLVLARVRADAFCHSMVRALVGASLAVGEGRRPVGWPAEVLGAGLRDSAVQVAPALGLALEEVGYPQEEAYGLRAQQARAMRTLPPTSPTA